MRPTQTPESESRRQRAFDVYFRGGNDGSRRSLRSIAQELGVALRTVQNWRDRDRWDDKIRAHLDERARVKGDASREVTQLLQASLAEHVATLNDIIRSSKKPRERILAIKEFVEIYRKLGVSLPTTAAPAEPIEFEDDLETK
jgi:transposase